MAFKRSISPLALLLTAAGGMVGSGWLFGPLYATHYAGPAAIVAWALGGVLMLFVAMTFAELSAMFPVAGGLAKFAEYSHDSCVSFAISWMAWLSSVVVAPIETMALLQYLSNFFPSLTHHGAAAGTLTSTGIASAVFIMFLMCWLNQKGAQLFSRINSSIVVLKLSIPLITVATFLCLAFHPHNFGTSAETFAPFGFKGILVSLPISGVIFSFIGYSPAMQLAGEAKNPQRAIPLAIIGSLLIAIVLYVLIQTAFVGVIPPAYLSHGWAHLHFDGINGPIAGLAKLFGLTWLVVLIYVSAVFSPFGTAFTYTASTARMNHAMSDNGYFPRFMQKMSKEGVPTTAIMTNFFVGLILLLPFPSWQHMVTFLVLCIVLAYMIGPLALMCLRVTQPETPRPFKLPCAKLLAPCAFYICNLIAFWTGWETLSKVLMALGVGYVLLFITTRINRAHTLTFSIQKNAWLFAYLIGLGVLSYLSTFKGGIGLIPFGWDFLYVGLFSWLILRWAVPSRSS